jgi:nucleoside-diphosphate-sugar epimerase
LDIKEIIHCAGCLRYFDPKGLYEGNVLYTKKLLEMGNELKVEKFLYVSPAFSCGYTDQRIREALPPEPASDPTDYTRSKSIFLRNYKPRELNESLP